jgi:hypothetical protein
MKPYIYLFFDLVKNKPYYVGKHNGTNKSYVTGSKILRRYIGLFGKEVFKQRFEKQILEYTFLGNLDSREEYYIKKYNTKTCGGNLTWGGKYDVKVRTNPLKPVLQYDLEGNFIKEWEYVRQYIDLGFGTDYNGISSCCLGNQRTSMGYVWRFKDGDIPLKIEVPNKKSYKKRIGSSQSIPVTINNITYSSKTECMKILNISQNKLNRILCQK